MCSTSSFSSGFSVCDHLLTGCQETTRTYQIRYLWLPLWIQSWAVFASFTSSFSLTFGLHMLAGLRNWTLVMLAVLQHLSGKDGVTRVWLDWVESRASLSLFVSGIRSHYGVNYTQARICAVKNSTVVIPCTFSYPSGFTVTRVMWGHERNDLYNGPFLFDSNETSPSRFQYNGDKQSNCSFTIQRIVKDDSGKYAFRFMTSVPKGRFTGVGGSTLQVTGTFLVLFRCSLV